MNEQAEQVIAEMLQRVLDGVDTATEFAKQEIPDVVQQLLVWHFWESTVWAIVGVAMLVGYWAIYWRVIVPIAKREADATGDADMTIVAGIVLSVVYLIVATANTLGGLVAIKIAIAPKLYLLEYGASLVK